VQLKNEFQLLISNFYYEVKTTYNLALLIQ
jgi:hypothetical protein